jgi:HEAT repeat protein
MKVILMLCLLGIGAVGGACAATGSPTQPTPVLSSRLAQYRETLFGPDDISRLSAIAQLEVDGSPEAVMILGSFFMDADVMGRLEAARALLRINTPQAQSYIRTAMTDKPLTARRQVAMQALEGSGEPAYPFLQKLLRDPDATVRLNTVMVIPFIGTAQARALLQIALQDSSPDVQKAAAEALRGLGYVPSPQP